MLDNLSLSSTEAVKKWSPSLGLYKRYTELPFLFTKKGTPSYIHPAFCKPSASSKEVVQKWSPALGLYMRKTGLVPIGALKATPS